MLKVQNQHFFSIEKKGVFCTLSLTLTTKDGGPLPYSYTANYTHSTYLNLQGGGGGLLELLDWVSARNNMWGGGPVEISSLKKGNWMIL